jgi:hypothetical protein
MLPPLPQFFSERERAVRWQDGRKKLGERAGARGLFWTTATRESPSSDRTATFSPEEEKGHGFTRQRLVRKLLWRT